MTTISVLGSGIMATALSWPLTDNGHEVRLVGTHLDRDIIDSIKETGIHPNLDLRVPEGVHAYQLEEAEEAFEGVEIAMSGVNSFGVRWAGEQLASLLKPGMMILAVAKGMEADESDNLRILPEVLASEAPEDLREQVTWSAITGPAIAGEVAVRHVPAWSSWVWRRTCWRSWRRLPEPITTTSGPARISSGSRCARR